MSKQSELKPDMLAAALEYAAMGWHVFPLNPGTKVPNGRLAKHGKNDATTDEAQIRDWWGASPNANIGISCALSGLIVIDPDTYKPECDWADFSAGKDIPDTVICDSSSGGQHIYLRASDGVECDGEVGTGWQIIRNGYVVAPPSYWDGDENRPGGPYTWAQPPGLFEVVDCPDWMPRKPNGAIINGSAKADDDLMSIVVNKPLDLTDQKVSDVLDAHPAEGLDYDAWLKVGMAIYHQFEGSDAGYQTWLNWSTKSSKHDPQQMKSKWRSFGGSSNPVTMASIIQAAGWRRSPASYRSYEELLEAAQNLEPDDLDIEEMEQIIIETAALGPIKRDAVHRAIKAKTKTTLGVMRDTLRAEGELNPDPDHLEFARMTLAKIGCENIICANAFAWRWTEGGVWVEQNGRAIKQEVHGVID